MPSNHFNCFCFEWLHPGRATRVLLFTGLAVYKIGFTLKTSWKSKSVAWAGNLDFFLSITLIFPYFLIELPRWTSGKESICQCRRCKSHRFSPWVGKTPWRRKWYPIPVFLPRESHGQRSLVGYSPWGPRVGHGWACTHTYFLISSKCYLKKIMATGWEQGRGVARKPWAGVNHLLYLGPMEPKLTGSCPNSL